MTPEAVPVAAPTRPTGSKPTAVAIERETPPAKIATIASAETTAPDIDRLPTVASASDIPARSSRQSATAIAAHTPLNEAAPERAPAATRPQPAPNPVEPPRPVATGAAAATATASASPLRLYDLPAAKREQLPTLKISMHMWNPLPAQRFAIIDGARVGEGDRIGNAVVERITEKGVLLDWQGRRLELPIR